MKPELKLLISDTTPVWVESRSVPLFSRELSVTPKLVAEATKALQRTVEARLPVWGEAELEPREQGKPN